MAVSLQKGGNVSLTKSAPGLTAMMVGLGWDVRKTDGAQFDLDASALMVDDGDKVISDSTFVFYGNPASPDGSVKHMGDNRTGEGEGDDEQISIDLTKVPAEVKKIHIAVSIYEGDIRNQNFGMVNSAFIRTLDQRDNSEIARFDLSEDGSTERSMIFGTIYRKDDGWSFKAVGQGYADLAGLARTHGVNIS